MAKAGGIPEKTSDFNAYLKIVIPLIVKNSARFEIANDIIDSLKKEWGMPNESGSYPAASWNGLYEKRISPALATSLVKQMLRAKRLRVDKMLRAIFRWAVYRMSPEERLMTGRKLRVKKNKRMPVPNRAPWMFIARQTHTVITLRLRDPKFPSLRRRPAECQYLSVEYEIHLAKGKIKNGFATTGKTLYHLRVEDKFTGKKIKIRSCYSSRHGNGPWSNWLEAIVI